MAGNTTGAGFDLLSIGSTEHYRTISSGFGGCHQDPVNVALHFVTTPLGMVGAFSLLHTYTQSSSFGIVLATVYLLTLLPTVPSGVFVGTAVLCAMIVLLARQWKLNFPIAIFMVVCGYLVQDMAHLATGEPTFQASYSNGGQVRVIYPCSGLFLLSYP
jgi:uncharacterized membrane protein YGL010W